MSIEPIRNGAVGFIDWLGLPLYISQLSFDLEIVCSGAAYYLGAHLPTIRAVTPKSKLATPYSDEMEMTLGISLRICQQILLTFE
jgi:hypothetical protein